MNKRLGASIATALLSVALTGCGGAKMSNSPGHTAAVKTSASAGAPTTSSVTAVGMHTATAPLAAPQRPGIDDTYDEDEGAPRRVEEGDDREIEIYGHPASPAEWRQATAFAHAYFRAATAEDGTTGCSLLTPSLRTSLGGKHEAPDEPPYLHGKTCAQVMTKLFAHRHKLMSAEAAGLEVTDVRVTEVTTFILLAFKGIRERRYMGVESRNGSPPKLEALIDSQYP